MTGRERVYRSLNYTWPNALIVEGGYSPATWQKYREALEPYYMRLPNDFGSREPYLQYDAMPPEYQVGNVYLDAWGCQWECRVSGMQGIITRHALADWADFTSYRFPDPETTFDLYSNPDFDRKAYAEICKARAEQGYFVVDGSSERLWERVHFLRGYENTMFDLGMDEPLIRKLIAQIVEYNLRSTEKFLEIDEIDCIAFQDDWGEQNRLMISPEMWREYFYEGYRKVFQSVQSAGKKVYFHTDGYLLPVIGDLHKAGADIINVQSACQTIEELKAVRSEGLVLSVDLDRQFTMPFATAEGMKQHVRDIYYGLDGARGGLWVKMDVYPDTPLSNIRAMVEVFEELRSEPNECLAGSGQRM